MGKTGNFVRFVKIAWRAIRSQMMLLKYCFIPAINSTLTLNGSNFQNITVGYYTFWGAMNYLMVPGPFNMALFDDDNQDFNLSGQEL